MKHFLSLILGVTLSALLGVGVMTAAAQVDDVLLSKIFQKANVDRVYENEAASLEALSNEANYPFENLYLFMLQNSKSAPQAAALEKLATITPYSQAELESILLDSQVDLLNSEKLSQEEINAFQEEINQSAQALAQEKNRADAAGGFEDQAAQLDWLNEVARVSLLQDLIDTDAQKGTQAYALNQFAFLKERFDREVELQTLTSTLSYEALATELFFNQDLSDSAGIDILYDFDLIHFLLFGDFIEYPDRQNSGLELASEPQDVNPQVQVAAEEGAVFSPYACWEDGDLREALDTFESEGGVPAVPPGAILEDDFPTVPLQGEAADLLAEFEQSIATLQIEKGDWTRPVPCTERFCIRINLVTGSWGSTEGNVPEAAYEETENCIACHVQYIQQRMDEMLSHSLVPSTVSTNVFEPAICKIPGDSVQLDLNVYTVKQPIQLDPGEGLNENAGQSVQGLKESLISLGGLPEPGSKKTLLDKTLSDLKCESKLHLHDLGNFSEDIGGFLDDCLAITEEDQNTLQNSVDEVIFEASIESASEFYKQLGGELFSLMQTFQSYNEALEATYLTGDAPLSQLLNKAYCQ